MSPDLQHFSQHKGLPRGAQDLSPDEVHSRKWNVLSDDLALPVLALRDTAVRHNIDAMTRWCREHRVFLAPHGKTSMCPQLWKRQLAPDTSWGMTVATPYQASVAAAHGVTRILIANQVVGASNAGILRDLIEGDPELDILCLADSVDGVSHLAEGLEGLSRPLGVLVEWGNEGWRTGVRAEAEMAAVLGEISRSDGRLRFRGFEGYEGLAKSVDAATAFVEGLLGAMGEFSDILPEDGGRLMFSIGGTAFLDVVAGLATVVDRDRFDVVIRSGCYVTHDHGVYGRALDGARDRDAGEDAFPAFVPALELWTYVQSVPEPGLAILNFGKRDCAYDIDLPVPLAFSPAGTTEIETLGDAQISRVQDQHGFLTGPAAAALKVGDRVCLGMSHPCTAFDKWRVVTLIDDDRTVLDLYSTFF